MKFKQNITKNFSLVFFLQFNFLHILLEVALSCRELNSLQDYLLTKFSSSTLTMCKSQIAQIDRSKMGFPRITKARQYLKKNTSAPGDGKKLFQQQWELAKEILCSQRVK